MKFMETNVNKYTGFSGECAVWSQYKSMDGVVFSMLLYVDHLSAKKFNVLEN